MEYSKDGPFKEPVVRCDSCNRLLLLTKLKEMGACICGSRKVKNVRGFDDVEKAKMIEWGIDPDFVALFEPIDDRGIA